MMILSQYAHREERIFIHANNSTDSTLSCASKGAETEIYIYHILHWEGEACGCLITSYKTKINSTQTHTSEQEDIAKPLATSNVTRTPAFKLIQQLRMSGFPPVTNSFKSIFYITSTIRSSLLKMIKFRDKVTKKMVIFAIFPSSKVVEDCVHRTELKAGTGQCTYEIFMD